MEAQLSQSHKSRHTRGAKEAQLSQRHISRHTRGYSVDILNSTAKPLNDNDSQRSHDIRKSIDHHEYPRTEISNRTI